MAEAVRESMAALRSTRLAVKVEALDSSCVSKKPITG
jgi:hypothetical protein